MIGACQRRGDMRSLTICLLGAAGFGLFSGAAYADVIEIGEDGAVVVHRAPAVYAADGASEIAAQPASGAASSVPDAPAPLVRAANHADLSAALIEAVAWQESRLRAGVVSRAGAIGEMQLMPATARALGVDPFDSEQNFRGGATYLRQMLDRYDGDIVLALAAYNAGPGAVDRYGGVPPYPETRAYIAAILERLSSEAANQR